MVENGDFCGKFFSFPKSILSGPESFDFGLGDCQEQAKMPSFGLRISSDQQD